MSDVISFDSKQYHRVFHKASECFPRCPSWKIFKCDDVWVYVPSRSCFLVQVQINEIVEWGIAPKKGTTMQFEFPNAELTAFYNRIYTGPNESRKCAIAE